MNEGLDDFNSEVSSVFFFFLIVKIFVSLVPKGETNKNLNFYFKRFGVDA